MSQHISEDRFERIKKFAQDKQTPFLILDLKKVEEKYNLFKEYMPFAKVYYAVKSNPCKEVIALLADMGSCFDVASIYEMNQILELGVSPERLSYGNTIKKSEDIKYAFNIGVKMFVTDSEEDLKKIAINAPGAKVFFRIMMQGDGATFPLSKKFGAHPDVIYKLVLKAKNLGLEPYGISFHVGSQQADIGQWDNALSVCKYLFDSCKEDYGVELKMINMGGGLPSCYLDKTNDLPVYMEEIKRFLYENFGDELPEIIFEPGRSMVGDSGVLVSEIITASKRSSLDVYRWVYLDSGLYNGLFEALGECIKFPIICEKDGPCSEVILAGPTCDSMDTLYTDYKYSLPNAVTEGDRLYFINTGAYSVSFSTINFNGFPPLKYYVLEK